MRATLLSSHPRLRAMLCVIAATGSTVLSTMLNGALTIALPSIAKDVGLSVQEAQWPLTSLSLVNGALLLVFGGLADTFGRRPSFLIGVAWQMIVSLLTIFVTSGQQLIVASAAMGVGVALISPACVGMLGASIPEGNFKNNAFAALGGGQPVGYVIGLLLGGVFATKWRAIYYFIIGFSALFFALAIAVLPADDEMLITGRTVPLEGHTDGTLRGQSDANSTDNLTGGTRPTWRQSLATFDYMGAILVTSGLILLTFSLADAELAPRAWATPYIPSLLSISVVILCSFVAWERRLERLYLALAASDPSSNSPCRRPILPPSVLLAPKFGPMLLYIFGAWMTFNCLSFFSTLFLQEIQLTAPLETSVRFLPLVLVGLILNVAAGWLVSRVSTFILIICGDLMVMAAALIFSLMSPQWSYWRGMFWVMVLQVGPDLAFPSAQLLAVQSVGPRQASIAGSVFNTTTRLATSFGLAITSSIAAGVTRRASSTKSPEAALLEGYRAAGWACFAASAYALVVAVIWLRKVGIVGVRDPPRASEDKKREQGEASEHPSESRQTRARPPTDATERRGDATSKVSAASTPWRSSSPTGSDEAVEMQVLGQTSRPSRSAEV
ncbi:MFS general substrate transporter [Ceraceosorus guamensis]|uniref:MFS general substrate transporter n=1 Tax=Ceraceosorus guamensis TaxID=1522189 RepID=A0A316VZU7_9BASI|nr:MFS general substrate transporter [Ceraceosorus guamensis]PWN43050.1 MFS general substrate transporter [Ceraceosorus guamensis]